MPLPLPDFDLSPEQGEFRDTLRRFLDEHAPVALAREVMEAGSGHSAALWKRCCEELGLAGLAISEAAGGQGFGLAELGLALAESGRCLAPVPLLASAGLAARAVERVAGADAEEWLAPIATGAAATLAWVDRPGAWAAEETSAALRLEGDPVRVDGEKHFVVNGPGAERVFVVARSPGSAGLAGLSLLAVEPDAPGVAWQPVESIDPTRPLARLRLRDVPARVVGAAGEAGPGLVRALEEARVLLCCEMRGGMEKVLESAVDYAKGRFQFGRAIGSFQAIKHKCADMLIDVEGARSAVAAAVAAQVDDDPERGLLAAVAKAHLSARYVAVAQENIQIHGGVGYTWEYDAHLYYRRARASAALLGSADEQHEALARTLAASAPEAS